MRSWILRDNKRIESAADNMPSMRLHERSKGVADLQIALFDLGYLPLTSRSFSKTGGADGIFGDETRRAVIAFQREHELKDDGIAGRKTLVLMDDLIGVALVSLDSGKQSRSLEASRLKSAVS